MATEKIYYVNQYESEFAARVVSCERGKDRWEIVLDRSAFYPEGGGQSGDTGWLGGSEVLDTHERGGEVVHYCTEPLCPGEDVIGRVDWQRRFDFMQQHSGEHIVSGIIHSRFGYENVGFHMGAELTTIDFSGELSWEDVREVESAANARVWDALPIEVSFPDAGTLKTLPYRSKKELTGEIRIVTIPDTDICACCGTHVENTGEIGLIKLISCQHFRGGSRLELLCGERAYKYVDMVCEQNRGVSQLLSAKPLETAAAAERMKAELEGAKYRVVELENRIFDAIAREHSGERQVLLFADGLSADGVRRLAVKLLEQGAEECAVFSGSDGEDYKYALGGSTGERVKAMNAALCGRGGGKNGFAQGSVSCTRGDIGRFFAPLYG